MAFERGIGGLRQQLRQFMVDVGHAREGLAKKQSVDPRTDEFEIAPDNARSLRAFNGPPAQLIGSGPPDADLLLDDLATVSSEVERMLDASIVRTQLMRSRGRRMDQLDLWDDVDVPSWFRLAGSMHHHGGLDAELTPEEFWESLYNQRQYATWTLIAIQNGFIPLRNSYRRFVSRLLPPSVYVLLSLLTALLVVGVILPMAELSAKPDSGKSLLLVAFGILAIGLLAVLAYEVRSVRRLAQLT